MELKVFDQRARFESEVYIGDYTEYVKTHEDCGCEGVVMKNIPLPFIASLHIHNPVHIPMLGVNFEENEDVFKREKRSTVSNCECMLPFSSFLSQPELLLDFKDKYGVDVFTDNNLKVVSHEYIMAMERE